MWGAMLSRRFRYTMLPKDAPVREIVEDGNQDEETPSIINIWGRRDR